MLCGTFWKGVPSGTKGAPSIDLIWVPLNDVLLQDSKCALTLPSTAKLRLPDSLTLKRSAMYMLPWLTVSRPSCLRNCSLLLAGAALHLGRPHRPLKHPSSYPRCNAARDPSQTCIHMSTAGD